MKFLKGGVSALVCIAMLGLISGCATVFANKTPEVAFASDPDGAKVYINGDLMGTTPVKIKLAANKSYTVEFRKEGLQPKTYFLNNHAGALWIVLDVVFGLVPVVIDAATGAWYKLDSDSVKVLLE